MSNFTLTEVGAGELALAGELTIYDAAEVKTLLLQRLAATQALVIDLAGVSVIDCAAIQVMLLVQREAGAAGKSVQWHKHSPAVSQVLGILNLGSVLGEPVSLVWS